MIIKNVLDPIRISIKNAVAETVTLLPKQDRILQLPQLRRMKCRRYPAEIYLYFTMNK
jgi:hypothetical protein